MATLLSILIAFSSAACQFHGKYGEFGPHRGGIAEIFRRPVSADKKDEKGKTKEKKKEKNGAPIQALYLDGPVP